MNKFCLKDYKIKKYSAKRIKDRGIRWEETYTEKTESFKKSFEKKLGFKSYFRWEGHDYTTNSDYFVVVGPAVTKNLQKRFFSGIKKYPKDKSKGVFAPSGEYFSTMLAALSFARHRWAVPMPEGAINYTLNDLANIKIPRHVKGSAINNIHKNGIL